MIRQTSELFALIRQSTSLLLTGPEGPDGDSIGACLALQQMLQELAPDVKVFVAGVAGYRYRWLQGAEAMLADAAVGQYDGVVVLDGDRRRLLPNVAAAFASARWTGIIDHHRSTSPGDYTVACFEPDAESTCGMVYRLGQAWGASLNPSIAAALYTGLIFDTGGFRYANTKPDTFQLAAKLIETGLDHADISRKVLSERRFEGVMLLGRVLVAAERSADGQILLGRCSTALMQELSALDEDIEGIVDALQHVAGVELAVLLVERGPQKVKLSLRSKGKVDVAQFARSLNSGGGGHSRAAGVALSETMATIGDMLWPRLLAVVAA